MGVLWGFKIVVFATVGGGLGVDGVSLVVGGGFIDSYLGVDDEPPKRTHLPPDSTHPISVGNKLHGCYPYVINKPTHIPLWGCVGVRPYHGMQVVRRRLT